MSIWALSDLHLALGNPSKDMEFFGPTWKDYAIKIQTNWSKLIKSDDLVLIPGDISWAMTLEEAKQDLDWIHTLPGTKLILKGNHDYWWASSAKMKAALPSSIHFLYNSVFNWNNVTIGGSRLWDTSEYDFSSFIDFQENPREKPKSPNLEEENQKIFRKELERLRLSLQGLDPKASLRIALTHYPPIGADLQQSLASAILEEFHIDICLFGHLHNVHKNALPFGVKNGVRYLLTSADYLEFKPIHIASNS
jgi:predicted phosphohydrolase